MGLFSARVVFLCQILLLPLGSNCLLQHHQRQQPQICAASWPWQPWPGIRCHGRFYPALVSPRSSSFVELKLAKTVETNAKRVQDAPKKKNVVTKLLSRLILDHPIWEEIKKRFFLVTRGRHRYWFYFRKWLRAFYQKSTVYVLECENGKYYVGSTQNKRKRFQEHMEGGRASVWTKENKPIRVLQQYTRIPPQCALGLESQVTAEAMMQYGVNNVRGAMFSDPLPLTRRNIDSLTRFLGHYNNLNYNDVRVQLEIVLPASPSKMAKQRRRKTKETFLSSVHPNNYRVVGKNDICFRCGKKGHWALDCPGIHDRNVDAPLPDMPKFNVNSGYSQRVLPLPDTASDEAITQPVNLKNPANIDPNDRCFKCGEKGHWAAECDNN